MAMIFFPYDSGPGANVTENQWRLMARLWRTEGIIPQSLNMFEVYADNTGMNVKVRSGEAWIQGNYVQSDAVETLAIANNDSPNPRIDMVVLRNSFGPNTVTLAVLTGTPDPAPVPPTPTQSSTLWEIPLGLVAVASAETVIEPSFVTDSRPISRIIPFKVTKQGADIADTYVIDTNAADLFRVVGQDENIVEIDWVGVPVHGQKLIVEITDDGSPYTIAWSAKFRNTDIAEVPLETVPGKLMRVGFFYDEVGDKMDCNASGAVS